MPWLSGFLGGNEITPFSINSQSVNIRRSRSLSLNLGSCSGGAPSCGFDISLNVGGAAALAKAIRIETESPKWAGSKAGLGARAEGIANVFIDFSQ